MDRVACTRLLHPWDFLGKSTGVGCCCLLQGILLTQGSNPGLLHCTQTLYCLSTREAWETWELKNWCFWTVVLEKSLESPLDCKEIQPVHPKRDHSWVFIGRTDVEAETPILWPLMGRTDSFEKALMLGKIEGRRKRGWQRMRWLNVITASMDMRLGELQDLMVDRCDVVHGVTKSRTWLSN